ncbi:uncharacterized protein RHIMIDRAFT_13656 [Rhizopus microsporus ATCC 52813]|uniref:Uncharacterized protein n=1 Tax=Rhizopus microsporus ATCC 52813 TaxID=1340429 RepID=A0A2G4TA75_RHIZD|nr:uncharacterized protein RHIMIDRAFT_13656 [Rhizopus microsporus ATCC 52813]PHZ17910.1 hypothetical protein RHIMIDRAFT_13656 [Rhizopus microsporus ATCC 52813]
MKPTITTTSPVSPSAPTESAKPKQQMSSNHLSVPNEPKENENSDDIFMELNENVYLQIQYIKMIEEHKPKKRRAIFIVPDPDLSDEIGEESSATWVELLGDVFYVGWLSNFTHAAEITDSHGIGKYFAWFVVMWWTWCSSALYSSRYDSGDVTHHVYKIIELCGLVIMAGASPNYQENPRWFIIGYISKILDLIEHRITHDNFSSHESSQPCTIFNYLYRITRSTFQVIPSTLGRLCRSQCNFDRSVGYLPLVLTSWGWF